MINYNYVREGKTCAIWTRVSTKHQEENGGSLESQKAFCDDYASRYGYRIAGRFGGGNTRVPAHQARWCRRW